MIPEDFYNIKLGDELFFKGKFRKVTYHEEKPYDDSYEYPKNEVFFGIQFDYESNEDAYDWYNICKWCHTTPPVKFLQYVDAGFLTKGFRLKKGRVLQAINESQLKDSNDDLIYWFIKDIIDKNIEL